jgi:hypothetical protein
VPFTSVTNSDVQHQDLTAKYNVIVLPSQRAREIVEGDLTNNRPPEFAGGIGEAGVARLKAFVADGGTLVCFDASCELALKQFNLPLRNALEGVKTSEFYCPGSVVALDVDTSQPLARGLKADTYAYFINSSAFELVEGQTAANVRVVARYAKDNVLRSGWLLGENRLKGKIALAQLQVGKGQIILFAFRPQHRGQTWGTFPFIWNALSSYEVSR